MKKRVTWGPRTRPFIDKRITRAKRARTPVIPVVLPVLACTVNLSFRVTSVASESKRDAVLSSPP